MVIRIIGSIIPDGQCPIRSGTTFEFAGILKERNEIYHRKTAEPEDLHLLRISGRHADHLWGAGLTLDGDVAPRDPGGHYIRGIHHRGHIATPYCTVFCRTSAGS